MNYLFFVIISLLCVSSCSYPQRKEKVKIEKIRLRHSDDLASQGIHRVSCGWRRGDCKRPESSMDETFDTYMIRLDSIEKARQFFCHFHDDYAKQFNQEKDIRPFLYGFPLSPKYVDLFICFYKDKKRTSLTPPYISAIRNYGEKIYYCVNDPEKDRYITIHTESFDVARAICAQTIQDFTGNTQ